MAKRRTHESEMDLTPMIDVVFQLIIFFIVTIKQMQEINETIILEDAIHGDIIKHEEDPRKIVVEISKRGTISINNAPMSQAMFHKIMLGRYKRFHGSFPVLIRGDYRTQHQAVKDVMDVCTDIGISRISFAAVKEHKQTKGRHLGKK